MRAWILAAFLFGLDPAQPPIHAQTAQPTAPDAIRGVRPPAASAQPDSELRQRKDYALLFATDEYDTWEPLRNPIHDAEDIAAELQNNYGFVRPEVVRNPTRNLIRSKLREYGQKTFGPNDQLFIFFAGHGYYDDVFQQGYIVAKDSRIDDENRGSYESYDNLRAEVNSIRTKHVLLVLDACFSGTFDPKLQGAATRGNDDYANLAFPDLLARKTKYSTRKFLTSGGKDFVSDGSGRNSPFAAHLLAELRTYGRNQGYLTFGNLITAVEATNPPPVWGEFGGNEPGSEFFFVSKELSAKLAAPRVPGEPNTTTGPLPPDDSGPASRRRLSVAVLDFQNISGGPDNAWLSTAISEMLSTELSAGDKLRTISREAVGGVKRDLSLPELSSYAADTLSRINKILGASYVVSGSYTMLPRDSIHVDCRIQDAAGDSIAQAGEAGSKSNLPELVARIGSKLRASLRIQMPTPEEYRAVQAALPAGAGFARAYAEGLAKLRAYDLLEARDSLQRAVDTDPKSALAHLALSNALLELGYDSKARLEAATAASLSGNLSPASRTANEANSQRLEGHWDRAIDLYRSLWTIYPDESDYALKLAAVQTDAGKGREALETLDRLRRQTPEMTGDPRVDYLEALAAASFSDLKRKQTAAARSAEKATQQGARLLAAQAFWQDCSALFQLGDQQGAEDACQRSRDSGTSGIFEARSMTVLANMRAVQGKTSEALELRKSALSLARDVGSRKDMIGALMNLANLERALGQFEEAQRDFDGAMELAKDIQDKAQLLKLELNIADLYWSRDQYAQSQRMFDQARQDAKEVGDQAIIAKAAKNSAVLLLEMGKLRQAEESAHEAVEVSRASGNQASYASAQTTLGDVLLAKMELGGARSAYEDAFRLFTALKDQQQLPEIQRTLGNLLIEEGMYSEAESLARQAVDGARRQRLPDSEASALETEAQALLAQGRLEQASLEIVAAQAIAAKNFVVRAAVTMTAAKVDAGTGQFEKAIQALQSCAEESARLGLDGLGLEIRLAWAAIEANAGAASRSRFDSLAQDSRSAGYLLIAAKAARLKRAQP